MIEGKQLVVLEKQIDEIFAPLDQCSKPGGVAGIAINGVTIYRKGFGLANVELPVVISPTMRMRIGSITKHFTCLAYMLLCEEGKAGIDDPVEIHFPRLHQSAHGVTMRQLMGHTSGLRDVLAIEFLTSGFGRRITDTQMLSYYATIDDTDFAPGATWSYNNGGYMMLSAAIERLEGRSLEEVMRTRIFEPLGMNETMLRRWDTDFVTNSATLHMVDTSGAYTRDYMGVELSGAGGIVSTADDMLTWMKHMDAPTIGSTHTWAVMRKPQILAGGETPGYGLGLSTSTYRGVQTVGHNGGVLGGNAQMTKVPSADIDIFVAVNRADASAADLVLQVIDLLVDGLDDRSVTSGVPMRTALYVSSASGRSVELTEDSGGQLMSVDGGAPLPVIEEDGVLLPPDTMRSSQPSFKVGEDGGVLMEFGHSDPMTQVKPERNASIGQGAGFYRAEMIDVTAQITNDSSGVALRMKGRHGTACYRLKPLTRNIWRADSTTVFQALSGIVTFDASGGFDLTAGRLRHLRFVPIDGSPEAPMLAADS